MGCKELIDALRKEGDEKARAIWQETEEEAEKIRADADEKIKKMQEEYSRMQASAIEYQIEPILSEAKQKADTIKLTAENDLSVRLYHLALSVLNYLRDEGYSDAFHLLVKELPLYKWERVKVNPEDEKMAKEYFSNAEIISDKNISGGLEVMTKDGKIRISNTFEKRLEKAWMEILPKLMRDIYGNLRED